MDYRKVLQMQKSYKIVSGLKYEIVNMISNLATNWPALPGHKLEKTCKKKTWK